MHLLQKISKVYDCIVVAEREMALTQFIQKSSALILRPHLPSLVPATSFQTSAPHQIRRYLKECFGLKPEFDEKGGKDAKIYEFQKQESL